MLADLHRSFAGEALERERFGQYVSASYHSLFFADVSLLMPLCAHHPRRSFAGEALERERFGQYVTASYHSGLGFARAKANLESINRWKSKYRRLEKLIQGPVKALQQQVLEMYGRRLAQTQRQTTISLPAAAPQAPRPACPGACLPSPCCL